MHAGPAADVLVALALTMVMVLVLVITSTALVIIMLRLLNGPQELVRGLFLGEFADESLINLPQRIALNRLVEALKLALWRRHMLIHLLLFSRSWSIFCRFKDTPILVGYLNLVPAIGRPVLGFLVIKITSVLFTFLFLFSTLQWNLVSFLGQVTICRFSPNDFFFDFHGSFELLLGDFTCVDFGRVDVIVVCRAFARKLIKRLIRASL